MNSRTILRNILTKCAADITGTGDPHPYADVGTQAPKPQLGFDQQTGRYRTFPNWRPNPATDGTVVAPPVTPPVSWAPPKHPAPLLPVRSGSTVGSAPIR